MDCHGECKHHFTAALSLVLVQLSTSQSAKTISKHVDLVISSHSGIGVNMLYRSNRTGLTSNAMYCVSQDAAHQWRNVCYIECQIRAPQLHGHA